MSSGRECCAAVLKLFKAVERGDIRGEEAFELWIVQYQRTRPRIPRAKGLVAEIEALDGFSCPFLELVKEKL